MCQKNHYARRAVTVLLAVLAALFVFGTTLTSAQQTSGEICVLSVNSERYVFQTRTLSIDDNTTNRIFTAQPSAAP